MTSLCSFQVAIETFVSALRLKNRKRAIQYLKLTKEIQFNDTSRGRYTTLAEGTVGYILNEEEVIILPGATWEKKQKMLDEMMNVYGQGQVYAFIEGYPCVLKADDYVLLDRPPFHCIGELI